MAGGVNNRHAYMSGAEVLCNVPAAQPACQAYVGEDNVNLVAYLQASYCVFSRADFNNRPPGVAERLCGCSSKQRFVFDEK